MFTKVLIANRASIAVRIEKTLKRLGISSVAVYSRSDQDSLHVEMADEAVFLGDGTPKDTYLNQEKIIKAALETGAQAIHPGYGFFSENKEFAMECKRNGIFFIGPEAKQIQLFGLKHSAREIAEKAGVPLLNGSELLTNLEDAKKAAGKIGYPVMLKSTAGGGGIGMQVCNCEDELLAVFDRVRYMAEENFHNGNVFLEKYIPHARHIEIQIFGNEYGEIITLGDRDCSVQRRNQKIVEESPAPGLPDKIRSEMHSAAKRLALAVKYRNAGTVEFLYDGQTNNYYFLEVNTRLQVEHGITEEIFGIDLVEWMILETAGELKELPSLISVCGGHAIEVRVYAEDCMNGFRPSAGKVDSVSFDERARIETWIRKGVEVTPMYDALLAKLIVREENRADAVLKMQKVMENTRIYGITTNLQYITALFQTEAYHRADLYTDMLREFAPEEYGIEVLEPGIQTTVQDYPGMTGYWSVGVPPCGPFDSFNFRLGNQILGNPEGAPGLEMTMQGGTYRFRTSMSICLTGSDMEAELDGIRIPMYQVVQAEALQVLKLKTCSVGMRSYLLIAGGFDIPKIMGSCSTFIDGKFGGHGGRPLQTGDVLSVNRNCKIETEKKIPEKFYPELSHHWTIGVLPGPQPTAEYLKPEYLTTLTTAEYEVNYNSARTGIRLNGPVPQWEREDGGEAGLHPSNIHDNAYTVGALDLTGDQSVLLGPDGPSLGGFVCPVVTALGERWKLGQLRPGDKVKFQLLSLNDAAVLLKAEEDCIAGKYTRVTLPPADRTIKPEYAILRKGREADTDIIIRLSGEDNILVEYGAMELNMELRFRVHVLMTELEKKELPIIDLTPGIRSLQVHFDISKTDALTMAQEVMQVNQMLRELNHITVPSRILHLPLSWDDPQTKTAAMRYQQTVRPDAPWCPSNPEFIRRINGLNDIEEVQDIVFQADYLVLGLGDVYLGAPVAVPIDPRHRMVTTKYNPARPWTPENAVGIGGSYLCVYGMEGPGGYQLIGRTIQMWNPLMETSVFEKGKPWLLKFFDILKFYPVSADEILQHRNDFLRGKFHIKIEETSFNPGEYKEFLLTHEESIKRFKEHQNTAFEAEKKRWKELGLDNFVSETETGAAFEKEDVPCGCEAVKTTLPGSVWKILMKEGDRVKEGDSLMTLESMKMEFPVLAAVGGVIEKIYLQPGQVVHSGQLAAAINVTG